MNLARPRQHDARHGFFFFFFFFLSNGRVAWTRSPSRPTLGRIGAIELASQTSSPARDPQHHPPRAELTGATENLIGPNHAAPRCSSPAGGDQDRAVAASLRWVGQTERATARSVMRGVPARSQNPCAHTHCPAKLSAQVLQADSASSRRTSWSRQRAPNTSPGPCEPCGGRYEKERLKFINHRAHATGS